MKKVTYTLLTIALFTVTSSINSAPVHVHPTFKVVSPQVTVTDIYDFLSKNLGLTTTQKPAVKTAVDEAGAEITKLNASSTSSSTTASTEVAAAKTSIVNNLVKKLSGMLNSSQSSKLSTLTGELTTMFSQLK